MKTLITGAGGSIGSEIAKRAEGDLILYDNSEYNLYRLGFGNRILGDVRDQKHIEHVFEQYKPDVVFHAAAIKHVPISEENPEEAILTNIFGTRNIAEACHRHKVGAMVLISTDKAVNPVSIMGKTKRVAEKLCHSIRSNTRFITVRFGNVLGTSGSCKPLFESQIERGGPLTITHPDMTRYFIEVEQAVSLVLEASKRESALYVLDMGKPVKLVDFARNLIGTRKIPIEIIGVRPGEKLHEDLFYENETPIMQGGIYKIGMEYNPIRLDDLFYYARHRKRGLALRELDAAVG